MSASIFGTDGNDTIAAGNVSGGVTGGSPGAGNDTLDGRGGNDLLAGSNGNDVLLGGADRSYVASQINPFTGIDVGLRSTPSFADFDRDGDLDLVVGAEDGTLRAFQRNANDSFTELTGVANPFNGINVSNRSAPGFADLDGDGDADLVVGFGPSGGNLRTFLQIGPGSYTELTGSINPFNGIDGGNHRTPSFADVDSDGDLDLVMGHGFGYVRILQRNADGSYTELTGTANPFNGIDVGSNSAPSFGDLDGDGDLDLVVGADSGMLRAFQRNANGSYTELTGTANPFNGIDVGFDSAPTFADLNGDGVPELVVGNYIGTISVFAVPTGHDTLDGGNGADSLAGDHGEDSLSGGAGNDSLLGGLGRDTLDGGAGSGDWALYGVAGASVTVNLASGSSNGAQGTDSLIGIEHVLGSAFADTISGDDFANSLDGGAGNDSLLGGAGNDSFAAGIGNDTLSGGAGSDDWVIYADASASVSVDLFYAPTSGSAGALGNDSLNGIEHVLGSNYDDTLMGGVESNLLLGGAGNDSLNGSFTGFGDDSLAGGLGSDTLVGSFSNNWVLYADASDGVTVNLLTNSSSGALGADSLYGITSVLGSAHADLLIGSNGANTLNGGTDAISFIAAASNPFSGIDVGRQAVPSFTDLDGDGDLDLVVGSNPDLAPNSGLLRAYQRTSNGSYTELTGAANPFAGVGSGGSLSANMAPSFTDLDADGDLDLVLGTLSGTPRSFLRNANGSYTELTGTINPFNGINVGSISTPSFTDLDGDGGIDLVVGAEDGTLRAFQRNANGSYTELTGTANPFNGIDVGLDSAPSFGDLDGDGDLDLVIGAYDGTLRALQRNANGSYTELTGTANPFNGIDVGFDSAPTFADLNGDAVPELVVGNSDGIMTVFAMRSINDTLDGGNGADLLDGGFGSDSLFGGNGNDSLLGGAGADTLNGGAGSNDWARYGAAEAAVTVSLASGRSSGALGLDSLSGIEHVSGSDHTDSLAGDGATNILDGGAGNDRIFADAGNDSLVGGIGADTLDGGTGSDDWALYASASASVTVSLATSNSSGAAGADSLRGVEHLLGSIQADRLEGDANANIIDGGMGNDLLIGGNGNDVLRGGTDPLIQATSAANPFNGINVGSDCAPSLGDLDADGDLDLVIGAGDGTLRAFQRNADGSYTELTGTANPFNGIDVGFSSAPTFADLNGDATLELVVGASDGSLFAFQRNANGSYTELTGTANPFNGIDVGFSSAPSFGDLDGDGGIDLVVGAEDGTLRAFQRNANGSYTELTGTANPFNGIDVGFSSAPSFGDLDGDGDLDLVIGASDGTLRALQRNANGSYTQLTGTANPFNGIDVGFDSAPTFADLNGDGALDLVVGNIYGTISVFAVPGGDDTLDGGNGADSLIGHYGADSLSGGAGNDSLFGGAGHDSLAGGVGTDTLDGGAGNDMLVGNGLTGALTGNTGDDVILLGNVTQADILALFTT